MRVGILASHPIQYQAPLFRALARRCDLKVYFAHRQTARQQGDAGYGGQFDWDVDLLEGYKNKFLENRASRSGVDRFLGCDTPGIADEIGTGAFDAFVVMGWNLRSYWQAVAACRRTGVRVYARGDSQLSTPRSAVRKLFKAVSYPFLLRRFDGFFALGRRAREYLRHFGVPDERIALSPHVVDNARFALAASGMSEEEKHELRRRLGIRSERRVIAYVGRLVAIKRPVDAVLGLAASGLRDWTLLVIGDGPERAAIERAANEFVVDVKFAGFRNQSELPRLYAICDALVLPGDETWGLVANEFMATGRPVIASNAAGCVPDLVDPGMTGESFIHRNVESMGRAIGDVAEGLAVGRYSSAIESRMENFSPDAAADSMLAFIGNNLGASLKARATA